MIDTFLTTDELEALNEAMIVPYDYAIEEDYGLGRRHLVHETDSLDKADWLPVGAQLEIGVQSSLDEEWAALRFKLNRASIFESISDHGHLKKRRDPSRKIKPKPPKQRPAHTDASYVRRPIEELASVDGIAPRLRLNIQGVIALSGWYVNRGELALPDRASLVREKFLVRKWAILPRVVNRLKSLGYKIGRGESGMPFFWMNRRRIRIFQSDNYRDSFLIWVGELNPK